MIDLDPELAPRKRGLVQLELADVSGRDIKYVAEMDHCCRRLLVHLCLPCL
jgi:hypothetical protein